MSVSASSAGRRRPTPIDAVGAAANPNVRSPRRSARLATQQMSDNNPPTPSGRSARPTPIDAAGSANNADVSTPRTYNRTPRSARRSSIRPETEVIAPPDTSSAPISDATEQAEITIMNEVSDQLSGSRRNDSSFGVTDDTIGSNAQVRTVRPTNNSVTPTSGQDQPTQADVPLPGTELERRSPTVDASGSLSQGTQQALHPSESPDVEMVDVPMNENPAPLTEARSQTSEQSTIVTSDVANIQHEQGCESVIRSGDKAYFVESGQTRGKTCDIVGWKKQGFGHQLILRMNPVNASPGNHHFLVVRSSWFGKGAFETAKNYDNFPSESLIQEADSLRRSYERRNPRAQFTVHGVAPLFRGGTWSIDEPLLVWGGWLTEDQSRPSDTTKIFRYSHLKKVVGKGTIDSKIRAWRQLVGSPEAVLANSRRVERETGQTRRPARSVPFAGQIPEQAPDEILARYLERTIADLQVQLANAQPSRPLAAPERLACYTCTNEYDQAAHIAIPLPCCGQFVCATCESSLAQTSGLCPYCRCRIGEPLVPPGRPAVQALS